MSDYEDGYSAGYEKMYDRMSSLVDQISNIKRRLKKMEWSGVSHGPVPKMKILARYCPICLNNKKEGHKSDCKLKELLNEEF